MSKELANEVEKIMRDCDVIKEKRDEITELLNNMEV